MASAYSIAVAPDSSWYSREGQESQGQEQGADQESGVSEIAAAGLASQLHNRQRDQDLAHGHGTANATTDATANDAPASGLLKFAGIPSQFSSHLVPSSSFDCSDPGSDPDNKSSTSPFPPSTIITTDTAAATLTLTTTTTTTPSAGNASTSRRTSPGLAARLKALGFGASRSHTLSTPQHDHIGRLDEEQLRQLDEKHQAGSIKSVIARRGRPWKGASATPSSSPSPNPHFDADLTLPPIAVDGSPPAQTLLPEITTSDPLDMDTYKYRLPDHTNGNGTKVTLDTRREHIERTTQPPSPDEFAIPPPPPPKDTPPTRTPSTTTPPIDFIPGLNTYFTPGHTRPGSIYTLSRASFANQLAQLTSLQLPDADSLANQVTAIPTAHVATRALINAAEQLRSWISKASEVIGGLDSEDDVEWAAAGGREGLAEVESAIIRFEELINAYVSAIEQLQSREDIAYVHTDDLTLAVTQMESIIEEWAKIRRTLQIVRAQVEIAMEWEELWNNVLGDIQGEMDELSRLVFEMEERRHKSLMVAANGEGVDISDLETIVEETHPQSRLQAGSRFSMPTFPVSPSTPSTPSLSQDDSSLLALFARMQPLRASLDFLPMRLSVFDARASDSFPTACAELETRRSSLDASYKKLEKDAESLRKELGEDRWVIVFRGAGRQAQKMHESVERSLLKLKEGIDSGQHLTNQPAMTKKIESYEAKKTHYGPAVERVLGIIDRGVKDRLTVNGEILRLNTEMQSRWESLKDQMKEVDAMLEEIHQDKGQQLRDSISSMLSNDRSTLGSGRETPGSSPPSSVIMQGLGIIDPHTPTSIKASKIRSPKVNSLSHPPNRRHSSLPTPTGQLGRKPGCSRLSTVAASSAQPTQSRPPLSNSQLKRPNSTMCQRPRWNASTNTSDVDTGHNFKPLTLTTPSPYAKKTPTTQRSVSSVTPGSGSRLPVRAPLSRATSESPRVDDTPTRAGHSRLSFRERLASPGPYAQQTQTIPKPRLTPQNSAKSIPSGRRSSMQTAPSTSSSEESRSTRPSSSLATVSRRTSLLPHQKAMADSESGRASPQAIAGARTAMRKTKEQQQQVDPKDLKPRWRH